jgi:TolB-like protein
VLALADRMRISARPWALYPTFAPPGGETVAGNFKLGQWLVEPGLNTVSLNGRSTHLPPKVMGVLVCLAQNAGEAVSKETLLQTVWPDTFVGDDVLKVSISDLRRVLEDDARDPRFIQTIPKRGYRLLGPVDGLEQSAVPPARLSRDSVVVLPFLNMSADPEDEFFADGITEEIINALAQIKELRVVARSSAFSFKGKQIDPRAVGEQLKVRTVLEGSVRRAGNRLRITAQLVSAVDGYHLWSERYDRELQDVFEIQDEIARSIAERLKVTLGGEREPLVKAGTQKLEAYMSKAARYYIAAGLPSRRRSIYSGRPSRSIRNMHSLGPGWRMPTRCQAFTDSCTRKLVDRNGTKRLAALLPPMTVSRKRAPHWR